MKKHHEKVVPILWMLCYVKATRMSATPTPSQFNWVNVILLRTDCGTLKTSG
ncbi:hypothetical protein L4C34_00715 [Vibrio profundum]|uniref:hypothetical protein n=1 Tax=Vibrio profundum TaxID=2910247 RepID=UPI003D0B5C58